jgi:carboxylesterase
MIHNPHLQGGSFYWKDGPVGILLVHGFTATTAEVRPLAASLHNHGYTVAGPLLPGHFTSPDDLNRVTWKEWVQCLDEAYQRLSKECQRVYVGGESTGGLLALYLASNLPEISGILTYAPAIRLTGKRYQEVLLRLLAPFIQNVPKKNFSADLNWQGYKVNPLKGALQLFRLQNVVKRRLHHIDQPLLVVQGRLDLTVHPEVPEYLHNEVSSQIKEIHWMERSSHCVVLDCQREEVAEITLRFLDRIESGLNHHHQAQDHPKEIHHE